MIQLFRFWTSCTYLSHLSVKREKFVDLVKRNWDYPRKTKMSQGKLWMATTSYSNDRDLLTWYEINEDKVQYMKGQQEVGESGYHHWQWFVQMKSNHRMVAMSKLCGRTHWELTRSSAGENYGFKDETRVEGTQFEYGKRSMKMNCKVDWEDQYKLAKEGKFDEMNAGVVMRCYRTIKDIYVDNSTAPIREDVKVMYFWGDTGTGKTTEAFRQVLELGEPYYLKSGSNKWWDGYKGEKNVIMDEWDGQIGVTHLLKWFQHFPTSVEIKGGTTHLHATRFWITSNVSLEDSLNNAGVKLVHIKAMKRRVKCTEFLKRMGVNK